MSNGELETPAPAAQMPTQDSSDTDRRDRRLGRRVGIWLIVFYGLLLLYPLIVLIMEEAKNAESRRALKFLGSVVVFPILGVVGGVLVLVLRAKIPALARSITFLVLGILLTVNLILFGMHVQAFVEREVMTQHPEMFETYPVLLATFGVVQWFHWVGLIVLLGGLHASRDFPERLTPRIMAGVAGLLVLILSLVSMVVWLNSTAAEVMPGAVLPFTLCLHLSLIALAVAAMANAPRPVGSSKLSRAAVDGARLAGCFIPLTLPLGFLLAGVPPQGIVLAVFGVFLLMPVVLAPLNLTVGGFSGVFTGIYAHRHTATAFPFDTGVSLE